MIRAAALASLLCLCTFPDTQQPRDNRPRVLTGTSSVHGVVVSDDAQRTPLRKTKVTISGVEIEFARTVITGDDGAFEFGGLPAGRYVVTASKDGYVTTSAGARRVGRPGLIELSAGGNTRVDLAIVKGAVITGRVQLPNSEPAAEISVQVFRLTNGPFGERRLASAGVPTVTTDDRGEYRIFGLTAGTYYVRAQPRVQILPGETEGLHVPTEAEIRAALAEVKTEATSSRPGIPSRPRLAAPVAQTPRRGVTLAPTYFPGTAIPSRAAAITLKPAEVRTGVDVDVEYVALATVEGFVAAPAGAGQVSVALTSADRAPGGFSRTTSTGQERTFVFRGVPPGTYTISARIHSVFSSGGGPFAPYWGMTDVTVSGEDLSGVNIAVQPGVTVRGGVAFDPTSAAPTQLRELFGASFYIQAANTTFGANTTLPPIKFDGRSFAIDGIVPGTYRFMTPPRGIRAPIGRWWLKSFVLNGTEMLDQELDLKEDTDTAVVTFSDRASELSGTLQYASGLAVRDEMVIVFSADPRHWFYGSRRIAAVRPTEAARYSVRNLPAGDYLVAVTNELSQGEWYDAEELKTLSVEASRARIGVDEHIVHDVRLNR